MTAKRPTDSPARDVTRQPGPPPTNPTGSTNTGADPELDVEHEGATEEQVGDRTGPGAGYDDEIEPKR
jgi:hypothetical protein